MILDCHKTLKGIALVVALCVMQVYVLASPASPSNEGTTPQANGTIKTTNNQPVIVNGNSVQPGTTILSGSTIQTPAGVSATLQLGYADLEITPGSEVTVEFTSDGKVTVNLKNGCVALTTRKNSTGLINAPEGRSTIVREDSRVEVCYPEHRTPPPPVTGGISKPLLAALLASVGAATLVIVLATSGSNPSPSSP